MVYRRHGVGQIIESRHVLMNIYRGSDDRGETAPGWFEHRIFRNLCRRFRVEVEFVVLGTTQPVTLYVVNYG